MQPEYSQSSSLFREFNLLNKQNYHAVVRFVEEHKPQLAQLPFEEQFAVQLDYCTALFEMGAYEKQLSIADRVIRRSIFHNIQYHEGEDIYQKTLFQKAKSLYCLQRFAEAEHIAGELVRLNPDQVEYGFLLKYCYLKTQLPFLSYFKAAGVLLFLVTIGVVVVQILVVQNFYPAWVSPINQAIKVGFVGGLTTFGMAYLLHQFIARRRTRHYVATAARRKLVKLLTTRPTATTASDY